MNGHQSYKPTPKKFNIVSQFCQIIFDKTKFSYLKRVRRYPMLNRSVLYKLEDETILFGRIYGPNPEIFKKKLESHGFIADSNYYSYHAKTFIVGEVITKNNILPYTDGFHHLVTESKEYDGYYSIRMYKIGKERRG